MGKAPVIWVTARFQVEPGQADALLPLLRELAAHSRQEPGCVEYGYYRNGNAFTSIEVWDSPEAERAHDGTEFLAGILTHILPLLDGRPQVMRWTRAA